MKAYVLTALSMFGLGVLGACSQDSTCEERLDCKSGDTGGENGQGGSAGSGGDGGMAAEAGAGGAGGSSGAAGSTAGSGGDGGTVVPIDIAPGALAAGWFNIAYSAQFSARGGSGDGFTWSVSDGDLPPGLTLDENGLLSGTPSQEGTYTFEVSVTDSEGASADAMYSMQIDRKRWLAYVSDEIVDGQELLWLVDTSSAVLPKTAPIPSVQAQAKSRTGYYEFSPDGRWLAYYADAVTDEVYDLYVVDVSGSTIVRNVKVNSAPCWSDGVWSPDSTRFAFIQGTEREVRVADVSSGVPELLPASVTVDRAAKLGWVSDSLLLIGREMHPTVRDAWTLVRWEDGAFGPLQETTFDGEWQLLASNAEDETGLFSSFFGNGFVVDFTDDSVFTPSITGFWQFSPDLKIASNSAPPDLALYRTTDLANPSPVPFWEASDTGLPTTSWTNGSARVAAVSNEGIITILAPGEDLKSWVVPGAFESITDVRFSPDLKWLGFEAHRDVWLAALSEAGPSEPKRANTALPAPVDSSLVFAWPFSPDSRHVLYSAAQETAGLMELYLVEVESPGAWRKLSAPLSPSGTLKHDVKWSADGSRVAYLAEEYREDTYAAGTNVYVVDVLNPTARGRAAASTNCQDSGTGTGIMPCLEVLSFKMQP